MASCLMYTYVDFHFLLTITIWTIHTASLCEKKKLRVQKFAQSAAYLVLYSFNSKILKYFHSVTVFFFFFFRSRHFVVSDVTALKKFNTVSGESFKLRKVSKKNGLKFMFHFFMFGGH